jgi:hypothetical protein
VTFYTSRALGLATCYGKANVCCTDGEFFDVFLVRMLSVHRTHVSSEGFFGLRVMSSHTLPGFSHILRVFEIFLFQSEQNPQTLVES